MISSVPGPRVFSGCRESGKRSASRSSRVRAEPDLVDPRAALALRLSVVLLPLVALSLRGFGFPYVVRVIGQVGRLRRHGGGTVEQAEAIVRAIDRANRTLSPIFAACLARSLTAWALLRWFGFAAELRIGARLLVGSFDAHAWVEWEGVVLGEDEDVQHIYAAFPLQLEHLGLRP